MSRALFIVGATGKQGGATIKALLSHASFDPTKYTIHALTRDPTSASAKRLEAKSPSIKLVKGDFNGAAEAFKNLSVKPYGVFIVTTPQNKPKGETQVGKEFIDEALKVGAKHIIFSSVERGSANGGFNRTDVPHFQTKHDVEEYLVEKTKGTETTYTILRPVFFLDNLEWGYVGKIIAAAWKGHVTGKLQVIDTEDIGKVAANAFLKAETPEYKNQAIDLAGDELSFEEANKVFKEKVGHDIPVSFGFLASFLLWASHDMGTMFKFFNDPGYQADIAHVNKLAPVTSFSQWIDKSKFAKKTA